MEPSYRPWHSLEVPVGTFMERKACGTKVKIGAANAVQGGGALVYIGKVAYSAQEILAEFQQLDGSPCGVEIYARRTR